MISLADVNVLFPILLENHPFHRVAWDWWEDKADGQVGICLLTRLGVLRLLTNAKAMGGHPISPDQALEAWDTLEVDPRSVFVEPIPEIDPFFRRLVRGRSTSPNLWTDAWLAALAASAGYRLTSFDRGFRHFDLAHLELLKS